MTSADVAARAPGRSVRLATLALVLFGVAHAATFLAYGPCDDEYIVYRYGRNLIEGAGWVFNEGERVEGFTVPLWTAVHAGGAFLGLPPVVLTRLLGLLAVGWSVLSVARAWHLLRPGSRFAWPALLVALSPALGYHAALGLGTTLLAALLAAWFADWARVREAGDATPWRAALWLGLAGVLRHEAVLLALPFLALERRRGLGRLALLALGPTAGWCLFRLGYFGGLLPSTWAVKRLPPLEDLAFGLRYLGRATREAGIGLLLVLAALAAGPRRTPGWRRPLVLAGSLGVLLHALYVVAVGGDYMANARFFVPTLPLAFLLACLALERLTAARPALLPALVVLLLLALQHVQLDRGRWRGLHAFQEERWELLGRTFAERAAPGTKVALSPVGAFGYTSRLPIVDLLGLTHTGFHDVEPDLAITMKGHQRYDAEWVLAREPDVVILGNGSLQPGGGQLVVSQWEATLYEHPLFQAEYRPMVLAIPGSGPLVLHVRAGSTPPTGARALPGGETGPGSGGDE